MKTRIAFAAAAIAVSFMAGELSAQRVVAVRTTPRAWLGFSFEHVETSRDARPMVVIREVVEDSPAQLAGLQVGDTVVSVNDLAASRALMSSLSSTLSPGDVVRIRIRRDGAESELSVEATERPAAYAELDPGSRIIVIDGDSIRGRLNILVDSLRMRIDSLDIPGIYIERLPGDRIRMRTDSVWAGRLLPVRPFLFRDDSLVWRFPRGTLDDSVFRFHADSIWGMPPRELFLRDTLPTLFEYRAVPGVSVFGVRAIAGAELTELSDGLADYFGVDEGLLVLRVPPGTPAARAGLQEGDVIVSAGGRDVSSVSELRSAIARRRSGEPIELEVVRRNQRLTVELERD